MSTQRLYCTYTYGELTTDQKGELIFLPLFTLNFGHERGWDLEPFAAGLQCVHLDTPLLEQQNTKKLYVTTNNCACPIGANSEQRIQKDQNTQLTPLKSLRQKQAPGHAPCSNICKSRGKNLSHPSSLSPGHDSYPHPK